MFLPFFGKANSLTQLKSEIESIVKDKDAHIGAAIIIDGIDTISINGNRLFPMLSVYKFPIAVALSEYNRRSADLIKDSLLITKKDLKENTYSPMREKYSNLDSINIPLREILAYSIQESDNNASDILLKMLPSVQYVTKYLKSIGIEGINIVSSEAEMHDDNSLAYSNNATPLAMAKLLFHFDRDYSDSFSLIIKDLMVTCTTGKNRLVKPLNSKDIIIGHKTGTGFTLLDGRLMAINDIGYIHLPNGHKYSIAVFIENSGYDMSETESIIAAISEVVYKHVSRYRNRNDLQEQFEK